MIIMTIPIRIKHNCNAQWNDDCDITTAKCSRDFDVLTIMIMMMIIMTMAFGSHTSQYQDG